MSQLAAPKMSRQRRPSIASAPTDPNAVMKTFPKTNDERKFLMAKVRNSKHFLLKDLTEPQVVMFVGALYVLQSLSFERIIWAKLRNGSFDSIDPKSWKFFVFHKVSAKIQ